jgi:hypothetical protein
LLRHKGLTCSAPAIPPDETPAGWWNSRWFLLLLVLLAAVPLILPITPPLTDLPEHMGRYRIQLSDPSSPLRSEYFNFHWAFIANLGVDLAIVPMSALFGLELGTKLMVIALVIATAVGMLWIAAEAHGRVPPTALFALPLAYSFPFIWGFATTCCRWRWRSTLMRCGCGSGGSKAVHAAPRLVRADRADHHLPSHIFGWAVLCLLAYAETVVRARRRAEILAEPVAWRLACLSLAPPVLLLVMWRTSDAGGAMPTGSRGARNMSI